MLKESASFKTPSNGENNKSFKKSHHQTNIIKIKLPWITSSIKVMRQT